MTDNESAVGRARMEGNYFFKQKQYEAAISAYTKGLDVESENVLLLSNLAQVYLITGQYAEAEDMACRAITLDPSWYKCYYRAAVSAENTGQIAKACDYLRKGVKVLENVDASERLETSRELKRFKRELARMEEKVRIRGITAAQPCGLVFDSDEHSEDYDSDTLSVSSLNAHSVGWDIITRSDSLGKVNISSSGSNDSRGNVDRSRSASVPPASLIAAMLTKKKTEMPPPKSTSAIFSTKEKKRSKKKTGPVKLEDLEADPFISFLSTASLVPDDKVKREKFFHLKKMELKTLLKEGSEALEAGIFVAAVEKFRAVYDDLLEFPYQDLGLKEMDVVVVKYLLCFSWISLTIYEDIVQAIKMMQEMEITYSSKFPAIYYALGLAFYKLNRYKSAAMYVDKGLEFIKKNLRLYAYPWPGTVSKPIKETTREGFENVLTELLKNCRTHHQPNAVCRYEDCRKLSQHIEPSELIFYNDPDFNGLIVVICEEKCRIEYHVQCWKDFKEASSIQKVTDKEMLGQNCPTKDCVTKKNEHSIIVRIEIMGENAAIKTSLDWTRNAEATKDARMSKRKHTSSESRPEKQKRSVRDKSEDKERESWKEQRRQEKYQKSELELDQECNVKGEEVTANKKTKTEEKQRLPKNQNERRADNSFKNFGKPRIVQKEGIKIVGVEGSKIQDNDLEQETENTQTKMLHENELGMSYDSVYDSDNEYLEGEECDNNVDIMIPLHGDDCFADCSEEFLLETFGPEWDQMREIYNDEESEMWDPCKPFCGAEPLKNWSRFLPEKEIECPEDEVKEFICSYMYEYLRSVDSQTIEDVDDKWIVDSEELNVDLSRVKQYQSQISELLLISQLFAALDDHLGMAEFIPVMYDLVKEELLECYNFVFFRDDETRESVDIYNSQDDVSSNEEESKNHNEIKMYEVHGNETENICDENRGLLNKKMEVEENLDDSSGLDVVENKNRILTGKVDGEGLELPETNEHQINRNSLNPDATEFCISRDSSLEVFKLVTPEEASIEHSITSQELDIQNNEHVFPPSYSTVKWSTEDGETKIQSQWDTNTIIKEWSTNDGEPESLNVCVQTENLSVKDVTFPLSDKTVSALTELLAPFSEDRQAIWTGVLKWTTLDSKSRTVSCTVLCSSKKAEHVKNIASLWPTEMTMQLVSRDFMEAIGFDTLCQLSSAVTFEPAVDDEDSKYLSQDLGTGFAGVIVNQTSDDTTFIVVIYFRNTHTYVGLAPHQCFSMLSSALANFSQLQSVEDCQVKKVDVSVQADGADYEMKLKSMGEENEKMKLECDDLKERAMIINSTVESMQSQHRSLQSLLEAKNVECAELVEKSEQRVGENTKLQETIDNLEKKIQDLDSKLLEQGINNRELESKDQQHKEEKQNLERRLAETEKQWAEEKNQIEITMKRHERSEILLNNKIEAVEETNRILREEANTKEKEFKQCLIMLTDENQQLQQKLTEIEKNRQELEASNVKLKAQQDIYQEQQCTHLQEMWKYKLESANAIAMIIIESCKGRVEELTHLVAAVVASGNTTFHNEVNDWLKMWQSCLHKAEQQLATVKETYPGVLERIKLGEVVNFPEFTVRLPSQPQNIVDVAMKINKQPLLPTPLPLVASNSSHFSGNSLYYPFTNTSLYVSQPSGFAQIPGLNFVPPQQHHMPMSSFSGNHVVAPEPVPDISSVRVPKAPFTSVQQAQANNAGVIGAFTDEVPVSADKRLGTIRSLNEVESPPLPEANSVEQQEKKLNTASRLKKTVVQQSLTDSKEPSMPTVASVTISNTLVQLQSLKKTVSAGTAAATTDYPVVTPKTSVVSKPLGINHTDLIKTIPVQAKPAISTSPFAWVSAAPTVLSTKLTGKPVKTVEAQQPSSTPASTNFSVVKPPSLLDLPTRVPVTQTVKVKQNPKPKSANFQKLLADLRKKYPNKSDDDLEACILVVRERNNRLTGLPLPTIITMVGKVLQEQSRKKDGGSMGLDKFGTTAWQLKTAETVQWSKPKDTSDEECTICIEPLGTQITTLYCKHSFHTACIRTWLRNESVCPICRVYTRMADEFPPLA